MKCLALATAALFAATAISSAAEISDGKVKIGILNDQSVSMPTSAANGRSKLPRWQPKILAAKCSMRQLRSSRRTTRTNRTSPRTLPANGTTRSRSIPSWN